MMYFRSLTEGIASLPGADIALRAAIDAEACELGWPAMHSLTQSRAKRPAWMSSSTRFISARVSSVPMRGPRV